MHLVESVGVDLVDIAEIARLDREVEGFTRRTFTDRERAEASAAPNRASYLAGRFAVKEAVFKAVAQHTPTRTFDLRIVETLSAEDGSPHVSVRGAFAEVCRSANVVDVSVSISNEGNLAIAMVACARKREAGEPRPLESDPAQKL